MITPRRAPAVVTTGRLRRGPWMPDFSIPSPGFACPVSSFLAASVRPFCHLFSAGVLLVRHKKTRLPLSLLPSTLNDFGSTIAPGVLYSTKPPAPRLRRSRSGVAGEASALTSESQAQASLGSNKPAVLDEHSVDLQGRAPCNWIGPGQAWLGELKVGDERSPFRSCNADISHADERPALRSSRRLNRLASRLKAGEIGIPHRLAAVKGAAARHFSASAPPPPPV